MDAVNQHLASVDENLSAGKTLEAEIDLSAIAANVRAVRSEIGPNCGVIAVVKANGYGLGANWVGAAAVEGGAAMLAVARSDEGVALRHAGYAGPILVMSYVPPEDAVLAVSHQLTVTLHRPVTLFALQEAALGAGEAPDSVPVHIKVDTGLGRYGCSPEEFTELALAVGACDRLRLEGLMTHFAHADASNLSFLHKQLERFERLLAGARAHGVTFDIVHAANSAAAMHVPEARFDMVRVGILLSGHSPTPAVALPITLQRAITLRTRLARVFTLAAGDSVGYGRTWIANKATRVGLLSIGYGDGFSRSLSNRGEVLVGGQRCPVIGTVSMDQTTVDVSHVPGVAEGDDVVVLGKQGSNEISADDLAALTGTISYEVLSGLSQRVQRRYLRDGQSVAECNFPQREESHRQAAQRKEFET